MSYYKKYLKYKNKYLGLKQIKNLQGGSSFEKIDFDKLTLEALKNLARSEQLYFDEDSDKEELVMILNSYHDEKRRISELRSKQPFSKEDLELIAKGRKLYDINTNYETIPDETILKLMNESKSGSSSESAKWTCGACTYDSNYGDNCNVCLGAKEMHRVGASAGDSGGGGAIERASDRRGPGNVIEKVVVGNKRVDDIINQTKDNIRRGEYDDLFTKIEYVYGTGDLIIRKIDLLMLAPYRDKTRVEQSEIIILLKTIPREILLKLFNDDTLLYPHFNRSYLNLKKGSIMSTLLIQGYFDIYEYIIHRLPYIILNEVDDLMILFNFILFREGGDISSDLDDINRTYIPLISFLKRRLEGNNRYLFSEAWFNEFIIKCTKTLDGLKKLELWRNQKTKEDKSILLFRFLKKDPELLKLFTGHSRWEDTVEPVIDDGEYSLYILLDDTINEEYINIIRNIFNN